MVVALDQWRSLSLGALATMSGSSGEDFERDMAHRYLRLHEALGINLVACGQELESQLRVIRVGSGPIVPGRQDGVATCLGYSGRTI